MRRACRGFRSGCDSDGRAGRRTSCGHDGRRTSCGSAHRVGHMGCDQVIVHIEHTLRFLPRCVFCRLSVFLSSFDCPLVASLKSTSCLSKFAQTWREKPAKHSDLVHFSGKSFRLGEKIRLYGNDRENQSWIQKSCHERPA